MTTVQLTQSQTMEIEGSDVLTNTPDHFKTCTCNVYYNVYKYNVILQKYNY